MAELSLIQSSSNDASVTNWLIQVTHFLLTIGEILILTLRIIWVTIEAFYQLITPKRKKSVKGEIVLITGAGQGIGRELALAYSSEGATVVCVDIVENYNKETVKIISDLGYTKAYAYTCDVSDYSAVMQICKEIERNVGIVTILINNAGILIAKRFCDMSKLNIERTINVNLMAQFWTVQAILPSMITKNYGHIVSISSISYFGAAPNVIPYCTSKYAVKGFMDGLRKELALNKNCQVKTTVILPYVTDTQMGTAAKINRPSLVPLLKQKDVAQSIIDAQRRDIAETSVPSYYYTIFRFVRLLPMKAEQLLFDFLDVWMTQCIKNFVL